MTKIWKYLTPIGFLTTAAVTPQPERVLDTETSIVHARVDLHTPEEDSARVMLISSEGERLEVTVERSTIDDFLLNQTAAYYREVGSQEVRVVVSSHADADIVGIERRDIGSRIVQVDGVNVRYTEDTERAIRQDGRRRGDPLELVVEVDPCRSARLSLVQGFRGIGVPLLMRAARRAADRGRLLAGREFRLEVWSAASEETGEVAQECESDVPKTGQAGRHVIFFGFDSADLTAEEERKLNKFSSGLPACEGIVRIVIEGHTCGIGPRAYNRDLGKSRATAVRRALVASGLVSCEFKTVSYGENRSTGGSVAKDRRVQIIVVAEEEQERKEWQVR